MGIDFSSKDERVSYLNEKLDDVLLSINAVYGTLLTDELVTRMERTVIDFNDEISSVMSSIKDNADKKNQLLHDLIDGNITLSEASKDIVTRSTDTDGLSAWEKKLEGL